MTGLAAEFRRFADVECRDSSPRYERLARAVADRPHLADPLYAAPAERRVPGLFLAAVQHVLKGPAGEHPLAGYFPTLGGFRDPDQDFLDLFEDVLRQHAEAVAVVCAARPLQTNEIARCAALRPGVGLLAEQAAGRPLGLVELGASAGLLLRLNRYGYVYRGTGGQQWRCGATSVRPGLTLRCEVRGAAPAGLSQEPIVIDRVGIDLAPVDLCDPAATEWLRSCVWPEHVLRLSRLDAALAEAARDPVPMVAGHMVEELPAALSALDPAAIPCVFSSDALCYLTEQERRALFRVLRDAGRERDLVVLLNEEPRYGADLAARDARRYRAAGARSSLLTLVRFAAGEASVTLLAQTGPYGSWIDWNPGRSSAQ